MTNREAGIFYLSRIEKVMEGIRALLLKKESMDVSEFREELRDLQTAGKEILDFMVLLYSEDSYTTNAVDIDDIGVSNGRL